MKPLLFSALFCFLFGGILKANGTQIYLTPQVPEPLQRLLLEKTGAKSISSFQRIVFRKDYEIELLAVAAELNQWENVQGPVVEGIMHVNVVFIKKKGGELAVYSLDYPIHELLSADKIDTQKGMTLYK